MIKDSDLHIKFAMLTGVSKFSKVSLFLVGGNRLATSLDLDAAQPNYFDSLVKSTRS
jgi:hypothetical protein